VKPLPPTSSSPAIAVEEEADLHRELPRPHRTLAFEGVAAEVAVGCSPSTGDTPRPLQPPDPRSPSTAAAAEVKPSPIRPPNLHKTHSLPSEEETKELTSDTVPRSKNDHSTRAGDEEQTRRIQLPRSARQKVHQLPASNRNDAERTEKEQEPPYSPHHRLPRDNDGAQKTGPRTTRTIYTTAQQIRGPPLFRQAKRPPESKGPPVSPVETRGRLGSACSRLSLERSRRRGGLKWGELNGRIEKVGALGLLTKYCNVTEE